LEFVNSFVNWLAILNGDISLFWPSRLISHSAMLYYHAWLLLCQCGVKQDSTSLYVWINCLVSKLLILTYC